MYETILVPTDGSPQSREAADHALEIARQFGSTVHALYVLDDRGTGRMSQAVNELSHDSPERKEMDQRHEEAGAELTDEIVERAREAGVDAESVVRSGDPAETITDYAEERGIDLIVLGARGRSAVGKFLLGDVAGKVARHATTPVMLIRPDE
ncbi:universal stress protein [Halalkalicoccus jeotgali]|uniref:UspA domain-containing protein n=1 Tax=Halalkalicoccus jeotgali (strain DSM 18796 / CECT 7217 / JCM 14584 / KCTC 4019 / B3) TaxID=795797 RepID=D8JA39_HALJB|nr:universal stress protein [Halalkalicoccus jeotgali]ADJ14561.1 UspA domain-containing protein [Halalkalicoccus jeotgali B3]ELY39933.1 UspA domain-containing protein [Halalkalicoccus jeotgali B3]